jgi:pyrroloquinoline quinone (PQQ) biosynthesis protein C
MPFHHHLKKKRGKRELYTYLKSNYPYQKQFSRGLEMLFKTTAGDMI